jgi:hypothetical protein
LDVPHTLLKKEFLFKNATSNLSVIPGSPQPRANSPFSGLLTVQDGLGQITPSVLMNEDNKENSENHSKRKSLKNFTEEEDKLIEQVRSFFLKQKKNFFFYTFYRDIMYLEIVGKL